MLGVEARLSRHSDRRSQRCRLVYLRGSKALIAERMQARKGHFMPPALAGQPVRTLEEPGPDEHPIIVDIGGPAEARSSSVRHHGASAMTEASPSTRACATGSCSSPAAPAGSAPRRSRISPGRARRSRSSTSLTMRPAPLIETLRQEGLPAPFYQPCDLQDIPALQAAIAEIGRAARTDHGAGEQCGQRSAA